MSNKVCYVSIICLSLIIVQAQLRAQMSTKVDSTQEDRPPPELSQNVYEKVSQAIVKFDCDGYKVGSGTLIGITEAGNGVLLTACHVVASNYQIVEENPNIPLQFHHEIKVKVGLDSIFRSVRIDTASVNLTFDLALVLTDEPLTEYKIIRYYKTKNVNPGSVIGAMGFPNTDTDEFDATVGYINRKENGYLIFDAEINPGNSGGPLVDRAGRMIGVSRATDQGEGYAVELDTIKTIIGESLDNLKLTEKWQFQPYRNCWEQMIKNPVVVAGEVAVLGIAAVFIANYFKPENREPVDLPEPPPVITD